MRTFVYTLLLAFGLIFASCGTQTMERQQNGMAMEGNAEHGNMDKMDMTAPNADAPAAAEANGISLHDPWARTGTQGDNSAAYMAIKNANAADTVLSASSDVAQAVELHTVIEEDGVMKMRPVEGGIEVPGMGMQMLKPGSFHVMLIGLNRDLNSGDTFDVTLSLAKAGDITVTVQVR